MVIDCWVTGTAGLADKQRPSQASYWLWSGVGGMSALPWIRLHVQVLTGMHEALPPRSLYTFAVCCFAQDNNLRYFAYPSASILFYFLSFLISLFLSCFFLFSTLFLLHFVVFSCSYFERKVFSFIDARFKTCPHFFMTFCRPVLSLFKIFIGLIYWLMGLK